MQTYNMLAAGTCLSAEWVICAVCWCSLLSDMQTAVTDVRFTTALTSVNQIKYMYFVDLSSEQDTCSNEHKVCPAPL